VGNAIEYDRWMPDARKFVIANQKYLNKMPVAFFFTCLALSVISEGSEHSHNYTEEIKALSPMNSPVSAG